MYNPLQRAKYMIYKYHKVVYFMHANAFLQEPLLLYPMIVAGTITIMMDFL